MKRLLAAAAAAGLVTVGALASDAQADPVRGAGGHSPAIAWDACDNAALQSRHAECGYLTVPLDYAHPSGATIKLAVSRIKHTDSANYQGVMLVNPGGPGGSGYALSALGEYVPDSAGAGYDWIGFDPRGVGASKPALTCDRTYEGYRRPPYVPTTAAIEAAWLARTRAYARACGEAGGALLDHLKTTDSARDIESLRRALGADRINYYGFSYGTYLGQVYATLYPGRVRRMVLDGNVDPGRVWYASNLDQDIAFDRNIKIYFRWLAKYDSVYHLGTSASAIENLFHATEAELTKRPADGVLGPDELTDIFLQAGYYVFGWQDVASAFARWIKQHDPAPLKALYDQAHTQKEGADNGYAIYLGVQCTDTRWPRPWARWTADNWRVHRRAPFETWANAWYNAPCRRWAGTPGTPVAVDGHRVPPVLLLGETLDAATPFGGSLEVRNRFPRSVLIEGVGGTTHAGSLFGNKCVDGAVAAYLADGTLPERVTGTRSDKRCPPIPQPNPTAPAAKRAAEQDPLGRAALQRTIVGR
jgi:pimeloyl-ACP methyl ester carboxylesterase